MNASSIVLFQRDLRIADNPALCAALHRKRAVVQVYLFSPEEERPWEMGAASRWWLHYSLLKLKDALKQRGLSLLFLKGDSLDNLTRLVRKTEADAIYWNRCYDPQSLCLEKKRLEQVRQLRCESYLFNGSLFFEPGKIFSKQERPYQVFTPFFHACLKGLPSRKALAVPRTWIGYRGKLPSDRIDEWKLLPKVHWANKFNRYWDPGEQGAKKRLLFFVKEGLKEYGKFRDIPALDATSRLSPHLYFGEISPWQIWQLIQKKAKNGDFLRELLWREFSHHLLFHFPQTPLLPLRKEFANFPWKKNRRYLALWKKGMTGFPIVDAGMRQLWETGWMHNRIRMIVSSFLVKDLMVPWQEGALHFWDTLVDLDLANNTLGWQWSAGCGADAVPFFRIFNPTLQGEKFDPHGDYIRRFVPEIALLPDRWIHRPHEATKEILQKAKIRLGIDYPLPMIDHPKAREYALSLWHKLRKR